MLGEMCESRNRCRHGYPTAGRCSWAGSAEVWIQPPALPGLELRAGTASAQAGFLRKGHCQGHTEPWRECDEDVPAPASPAQGIWVYVAAFMENSIKKTNDWLVLKRQLLNPCLELLSQYPWDIPPLDRGRWQEVHGVGNQMPSCLSHSMKFL